MQEAALWGPTSSRTGETCNLIQEVQLESPAFGLEGFSDNLPGMCTQFSQFNQLIQVTLKVKIRIKGATGKY